MRLNELTVGKTYRGLGRSPVRRKILEIIEVGEQHGFWLTRFEETDASKPHQPPVIRQLRLKVVCDWAGWEVQP